MRGHKSQFFDLALDLSVLTHVSAKDIVEDHLPGERTVRLSHILKYIAIMLCVLHHEEEGCGMVLFQD